MQHPRATAAVATGPAPPRADQASPQHSALITEGVEPVVTGLGALRGDGQQVGGAAAGFDAACKDTRIGPGVSLAEPPFLAEITGVTPQGPQKQPESEGEAKGNTHYSPGSNDG